MTRFPMNFLSTSKVLSSDSFTSRCAVLVCVVFATCVCCYTSLAEDAQRPSKTVFVAVEKAMIHSGPSEDYYPTGLAKRGDALEVYHEVDDWLGVRPPQESFSWVMAKDAYLLPGGRIIEVTAKNAVSWIGTEFGSAKQYRWQVQLQPGEQLAIVGELSRKNEDGTESLWYKIAPPSGEFRWINKQAVADQPPPEPVAKPATTKLAGSQEKKSRVALASAEGEENPVVAAQHIDDVFAGDPQSLHGVPHSVLNAGNQYYDGEIVYEDGYDEGSYVQEGYVQEGYVQEGYVEETTGHSTWDGWHALEFTDDGLFVPLLARMAKRGQAAAAHDPLNADPFSLSMAAKVDPPQSMRQAVRQDAGVDPKRRNTSWRDPRTLRERRLRGYPNDRLGRDDTGGTKFGPDDLRDAMQGVRDEFNQLSNSLLSQNHNRSSYSDGLDYANDYLTNEYKGSSNNADNNNVASRSNSTQRGGDQINWFGTSIGTHRHQGKTSLASTANPSPQVATSGVQFLQVAVSELIAQPLDAWSVSQSNKVSELRSQAEYYIEHGHTPIERGQARLILDRLDDFVRIAQSSSAPLRSVAQNPGSAVSRASYSEPAKQESSFYASNPNNSATSGQFDATGWLVPVHNAAPGQPSHALADDSGKILVYVSTLPGMKIDHNINQPVGITGLRGYLPQLQAGHIQAQRVTKLQ